LLIGRCPAAHCAWHASLTGAIVLVVAPDLWWLALIDFIAHASVDRGKGLLNELLQVVNSRTDVGGGLSAPIRRCTS
jgi:hypothetical protein